MNQPYRTPANPPDAVEIETDDVEATIHFLNEKDEKVAITQSFIGSPTASWVAYREEISTHEYRGSYKFKVWVENSAKLLTFSFKDYVVPQHRLLLITTQISERKEKVVVKK
jgi:hypothetical protein